MMAATIQFEPFDTWFFRESRPQGSIGGSELSSVFPPPARTLAGAIRTWVGDAWHQQHGTCWADFFDNVELQRLIGLGDQLGLIKFRGPFLSRERDGTHERLYPLPQNVATLPHPNNLNHSINFLLEVSDPVTSDLGHVRLLRFPPLVPGITSLAGAQPYENAWITTRGLQAILQGMAPQESEILHQTDLVTEEPRLGIARNNRQGSTVKGLLYQTRHLRLVQDQQIKVEMDLIGTDQHFPDTALARLGGEGRLCSLRVKQGLDSLPAPLLPGDVSEIRGLVLYLLTPARFLDGSGKPTWLPNGFQASVYEGADTWVGEFAGITLRLHAMAISKVHREGGWDMATHKERVMYSYTPAGSAYYMQPIGEHLDWSAIIHSIHLSQWGEEQDLGRGLIACGLWL